MVAHLPSPDLLRQPKKWNWPDWNYCRGILAGIRVFVSFLILFHFKKIVPKIKYFLEKNFAKNSKLSKKNFYLFFLFFVCFV
jgi:hypothetical protein